MRISLTNEEALSIIHSCLCDGGISELRSSGMVMDFIESEYDTARRKIAKKNHDVDPTRTICYEDVLAQILRDGKRITFVDEEGDGDQTESFDLKKAKKNMQNKDAYKYIFNILDGEYDAIDCYLLLQIILFNEIIFC